MKLRFMTQKRWKHKKEIMSMRLIKNEPKPIINQKSLNGNTSVEPKSLIKPTKMNALKEPQPPSSTTPSIHEEGVSNRSNSNGDEEDSILSTSTVSLSNQVSSLFDLSKIDENAGMYSGLC